MADGSGSPQINGGCWGQDSARAHQQRHSPLGKPSRCFLATFTEEDLVRRGGQGAVFKSTFRGKPVAVKVIPAEKTSTIDAELAAVRDVAGLVRAETSMEQGCNCMCPYCAVTEVEWAAPAHRVRHEVHRAAGG